MWLLCLKIFWALCFSHIKCLASSQSFWSLHYLVPTFFSSLFCTVVLHVLCSPVTLRVKSSCHSLGITSVLRKAAPFVWNPFPLFYPWNISTHSLRPDVISFVNLSWALWIIGHSFCMFLQNVDDGFIIAFIIFIVIVYICVFYHCF